MLTAVKPAVGPDCDGELRSSVVCLEAQVHYVAEKPGQQMRKLALAACISLAVMVAGCGESNPRSPGTLRASTRPAPVRPAKAPTRVRPVAAGSTVGLPRVTSTGARITALWQAPLTNAVVTGDLVVGLAAGRPAVLEAISESTGQQRWTASLPSTSEPVQSSGEEPFCCCVAWTSPIIPSSRFA